MVKKRHKTGGDMAIPTHKKGKKTYLEFFAGGGMAALGLGARWQCTFANDVDPAKAKTYCQNFPDHPFLKADIATLSLTHLPVLQADLAWASFPCQDLSIAGGRAGLHGQRSGHFHHFWHLIDELNKVGRAPRSIVLENVVGLLTSQKGRDFAYILRLLAQAGYHTAAMVLDARSFVPQSRKRVFIIASQPGFAGRTSPSPDDALHPPSMQNALQYLPDHYRASFHWLKGPTPQARPDLASLINLEADHVFPKEKTSQIIASMKPAHREIIVNMLQSKALHIGTAFRRVRIENGHKVSRYEPRFDGVAGCLRPPTGGSSRQVVILIADGKLNARFLSPSECAGLMGLPPSYALPRNNGAALKLCGDGVCVPVVSWLATHILEPLLESDLSIPQRRRLAA